VVDGNYRWKWVLLGTKTQMAGELLLNLVKGDSKMKPSTKDEVAGKVHEVKGKLKEKAGQLTRNPDLEEEGQDEKIGGKIQKKIGQVEKVLEQ